MPENLSSPAALHIQDLRIGYGGRDPLVLTEGLSFALPPASLTAVVGINGVGKSTLLRTLAGMQPALGGKICIREVSLAEMAPSRRAEWLSVVLTEPPASRNLTVRELVSLGRHPYTNWLGQLVKADREAIDQALDRMELQALSDRPCHTLSDGQLQRALIARALAQDTFLMLLDEPTTHLDLYHKVKILKGLQNIAHETGKTIVFTTHEIDLAIQLCDYLLVLREKGSSFGSPCELIEAGAFGSLFPEDTIRFDPGIGRFQVNK